ncbi:hypothetical protein TIFTF001_050724 [Ficus carica]|uniref:Uncharacterized protein n=1 Tax=Ficus carica TaxID=3494 RepID=A0AA87ZQR7_FICCA|nr:hypothetical protein TIFTF001_050724 [Ficus carica]
MTRSTTWKNVEKELICGQYLPLHFCLSVWNNFELVLEANPDSLYCIPLVDQWSSSGRLNRYRGDHLGYLVLCSSYLTEGPMAPSMARWYGTVMATPSFNRKTGAGLKDFASNLSVEVCFKHFEMSTTSARKDGKTMVELQWRHWAMLQGRFEMGDMMKFCFLEREMLL